MGNVGMCRYGGYGFYTVYRSGPGGGGGGTLGISGWGCAIETLEPLTYTRASSAKFCYPILELTPRIPPILE